MTRLQKILSIITLVFMVFAVPASAFAATSFDNGVTFTYPDTALCGTEGTFSASGLQAGWRVVGSLEMKKYTDNIGTTVNLGTFNFNDVVGVGETTWSQTFSYPAEALWQLYPDGSVGFNLYFNIAVYDGDHEVAHGKWDYEVCCIPQHGPGTGTPGYWKTHPEAWPVTSLVIGGVSYTREQAIALMLLPDGDKTLTLFRALVSAELNVLIGNADTCVDGTMAAAHTWLATYPPLSGVVGKSAAWKAGEPLYLTLDAYNNGLLCAPHRD